MVFAYGPFVITSISLPPPQSSPNSPLFPIQPQWQTGRANSFARTKPRAAAKVSPPPNIYFLQSSPLFFSPVFFQPNIFPLFFLKNLPKPANYFASRPNRFFSKPINSAHTSNA